METMVITPEERAEWRRSQKEIADQLKASGALDDIFAQMDAGTPPTGEDGLLGGIVKAALASLPSLSWITPSRCFSWTLSSST